MELIGKVLAAPPANVDEYWGKSVVFVYEQNLENSVGVMVNKPSDKTVAELCEHHNLTYHGNENLYLGGPVNPSALLMLHSRDWQGINTLDIDNQYRVTSDKTMLHRLCQGDRPKNWKLVLGMSAWKIGQLEGEISGKHPWSKSHSWLVADANNSMLFGSDPEAQWNQTIRMSGKNMIDKFFSIQ
jgi:putative transcriptional regulator